MGLEDDYIWDSFKRGNERSLKFLYDEHYEFLFHYGYKFTNDRNQIEEAIQSLFIKMWKNHSNLNKPASIRHYLLKAFRRILIAALQAGSRLASRQRSFEDIPFYLTPPHDENIIRQEEINEQHIVLKTRIGTLTNRQREAIYLRFYQELSFEEIAVVLKMNIGGVYKLIYRAIDRLRTGK